MTQNGVGSDAAAYDVYLLRGLGYGGEEVWDQVISAPKEEAVSFGQRIKEAGKVAVVVPKAAAPDSLQRRVFQ